LKESNFLNKDMKKTMLKLRILRRISKSDVNSYALLNELEDHKHFARFFENKTDMKNEVYNTINSLENSAYIKSTKKIENGRLKNYYTLTPKGKFLLKSAAIIFKRNLKDLKELLNS
jgi:DNA-binding PadR family transcriptional regulator